jgi:hypothetical protein
MNNLTTAGQVPLRGAALTIATYGEYAPILPSAATVLLDMLRAAQARREVPASSALAA